MRGGGFVAEEFSTGGKETLQAFFRGREEG